MGTIVLKLCFGHRCILPFNRRYDDSNGMCLEHLLNRTQSYSQVELDFP